MPDVERRAPRAAERVEPAQDRSPQDEGRARFTQHGEIPAVGTGERASSPTASARGFGPHGQLPTGDEGFKRVWDGHPHNYMSDRSQNTDSMDILDAIGLPRGWNTCAMRLSMMFNGIGEPITPEKAATAGIARSRLHYNKQKNMYYVLSAKEMSQYITATFRKADVICPALGRFKDAKAFDDSFETTIKAAFTGRRGIVAFDKIFGDAGTGHVDVFDGEQLSDSYSWFPAQQIQLWYI